jgi:hypothetical protein
VELDDLARRRHARQRRDWAVTGDDGGQCSVAATVFESTCETVGENRYRRASMVLATRAGRREVIPTWEGDAVAHRGDWIVQGARRAVAGARRQVPRGLPKPRRRRARRRAHRAALTIPGVVARDSGVFFAVRMGSFDRHRCAGERRLPMRGATSHAARAALSAATVMLLGYLMLRAIRPRAKLPEPLGWFGEPGRWPTIAIVAGLIVIVGVMAYRSRRNRSSATVPVMVVIGLTLTGLVLGFTSYWACVDAEHPTFFSPLIWTAQLVKGGVGDMSLKGGTCPPGPPIALDVARLTILGAIFVGVTGAAAALFRAQYDWLLAAIARSVTAVVDVDDDAQSMSPRSRATSTMKTPWCF